jgi:curved DNA-binding protein CbpA
MRLGPAESAESERVPRLARGCDPAGFTLSPAEGYLLSRIDGHTSWDALRKIGGLPAAEVDRCLERWAAAGLVEWEGGPAAPGAPPRGTGHLEPDPSLELDVAVQRRVIDFAGQLDRPYHEILGVPRDADVRTIKKAYFALSKTFHPDRYFRRELGALGPLIERCFKRILEAYELLSDPVTRAEVQAAAPAAAPVAAAVAQPGGAEVRRRLVRRLDQLTGHGRARTERRRKAKSFFEAGMAAFAKERWLEAAGAVRLSIAFDPECEAYREHFVDVQRKAHDERAKMLVKQAEGSLEMRDWRDALELFEEAVAFRPGDAELAFRAARLAWQAAGELKKAKDLAAAACELEPGNALYRRTLGQIYAAAGLTSNARRELEKALELDPGDKDAKAALRGL